MVFFNQIILKMQKGATKDAQIDFLKVLKSQNVIRSPPWWTELVNLIFICSLLFTLLPPL